MIGALIANVFMLSRVGLVLLKAAEKRLPNAGVEAVMEALGAKNLHMLLPPPEDMIRVSLDCTAVMRFVVCVF